MKKYQLWSGVFIVLTFIVLISSCSKSKNSSGNQTGTYYFKGDIGGKSYNESVTSDGKIEAGAGVDGVDDVLLFATIENNNDGSEFAISKGTMHSFFSATQTDLKNFFAAGTYNYSIDSQNGIEISWNDANGKTWSTSNGSGNQTGSNFKIVSVADDPDALNRYYIKVKSTFNCILYDDGGNSMTVTGGEMVGTFGPLN